LVNLLGKGLIENKRFLFMVNLTLEQAMKFVKEENPSLSYEEIRVEALRMIEVSNQNMNDAMLKE
jgi:hypothetical protein